METSKIKISNPRRFGWGGILKIYLLSHLLLVPMLIALLLVSVIKLSILTIAIPVLALAGTLYLLPTIGNAYIKSVVPASTAAPSGELDFVVQLTFTPRIRNGIRALIEDADDFGRLTLMANELNFRGDSVAFSVPYSRIRAIHADNVGLRGIYVASGRIRLEISGLQDFESVEIAERSSKTLPASRKISREILKQIRARTNS